MRFGREMNDCIRLRVLENTTNIFAVADVEFMKGVTGVTIDARKRGEICGVCQLVDIDDVEATLQQRVPAHRRADEPGPTRNNNPH